MEHSTIFSLKDSVDYANGSVVSKQILKKKYATVTLFAFDAGQSLSEHTAPFDALVHVTDGRAEFIIGGNSFNVSDGESIILPANVPHAVNALSRFKMLLTMLRE